MTKTTKQARHKTSGTRKHTKRNPSLGNTNRTSDLRIAAVALELLRYPRRYVRSLDHRVKFLGLAIRHSVTMEVELPLTHGTIPPGDTILVPIIIPRRGEIVANLEAHDGYDRRVRTLTYSEQALVTRRILLLQLTEATRRWDITFPHKTSGRFNISDALLSIPEMTIDGARSLSDLLLSPDFYIPNSHPHWYEDVPGIDNMRNLITKSKALQFLVDVLSDHYLILAECVVASDRRVVVKYNLDSTYFEGKPHRDDPTREKMRHTLGLRSPNYAVYLGAGPTTVRTFHFRIEAPRGHCISRCQFRKAQGQLSATEVHRFSVDRLNLLDTEQADMIVDHVGKFLPYAHICCENSREDNVTTLASVHVRERPPGSIGRALMISTVSLLPLGVVALIFRHIFTTADPNYTLPAFLVGVPGIGAAILGPHDDGRFLSATPLVAYVARLFTGLIAFAAALTILVTYYERAIVFKFYLLGKVSGLDLGQVTMYVLFGAQLIMTYVLLLRRRQVLAYLQGSIEQFRASWFDKLILKVIGKRLRKSLMSQADPSQSERSQNEPKESRAQGSQARDKGTN